MYKKCYTICHTYKLKNKTKNLLKNQAKGLHLIEKLYTISLVDENHSYLL
jgi:hypothetical protein